MKSQFKYFLDVSIQTQENAILASQPLLRSLLDDLYPDCWINNQIYRSEDNSVARIFITGNASTHDELIKRGFKQALSMDVYYNIPNEETV
jgi:hypothetical protein